MTGHEKRVTRVVKVSPAAPQWPGSGDWKYKCENDTHDELSMPISEVARST